MSLKGSKTAECLKEAFAGESMANRRYLYFANQCDIAGENDLAALFRSTAEGETGHAHGHMEYLIEGGAGEPGTGMPAKTAKEMLKQQLVAKPMSIQTCIQAWRRLLVKKVSMKLQIGLKLLRKQNVHMLIVTLKH